MKVSVIIPALNEADVIGATIDAAMGAGAAEVIVCDGGSTDGTQRIAKQHHAMVIEGERIRARQLNRGAETSAHEVLLFLHADTLLPGEAITAVREALRSGAVFGGFRLQFIEPRASLRMAAALINLRTRLTRQPWGDQAHFVLRDAFFEAGCYPDFPLMEDYELARRMRRRGRVVILRATVRTSGRRFIRRGLLLTTAMNWLIVACYHLGISPERLAKWYRR